MTEQQPALLGLGDRHPPHINAQHETILSYLAKHPRATTGEVCLDCAVDDPHARLGELVALGRVGMVASWEIPIVNAPCTTPARGEEKTIEGEPPQTGGETA